LEYEETTRFIKSSYIGCGWWAMFTKRVRVFFSTVTKRDFSNVALPLAALWFSIRVAPKPSRALYPCQQATLSLFLAKLGISLSALILSSTSLFNRRSIKTVGMLALVGVALTEPLTEVYFQYRFSVASGPQLTLSNITYGFPTQRVIRVHSNNATSWDFSTSYYWENIDQSVIDRMVEEGVKALTGASDAQTAWQTIMSAYAAGNRVGIKVNGNDWWNTDHREIDSIPQIVNSAIKGLKSIGVPESDIYIIENTDPDITWRRIPDYYKNKIIALYPNVVFRYDTDINPTFGTVAGTTVNFPYSPGSKRINDQIAGMDHLILMPIMKAITPSWGVTGSIKLMQGVIEDVSSFHGQLIRATADNPDVLIYQNQHINDKTRLILADGLYGAWTGQHFTGGYGGTDTLTTQVNDIPKRWLTFNNDAPSVLFFGVDPVAIDSIMYDHILAERNAQDQIAGQTLAALNEPQLLAGEAAGLGIREHDPPYSNIDYTEIELGAAPPTTHDLAVTGVVAAPTNVMRGGLVNVNVTVTNQGNAQEIFNVTLYYDNEVVGKRTGISLAAGNSRLVGFSWNTSGVGESTYTLKAEVSAVQGETDLSDNVFIDGTVTVNPLEIHDVAITGVSASPITVFPGETVNVTAVIHNEGTYAETFTVAAYANSTLIGWRNLALAAGESSTEVFSWNTTGSLGVYIIKANASVVAGEIDIADNVRQFDGAVAVFTHAVQFPVASFTSLPNRPLIGENVTFDAAGSYDPDGIITSYLWDFGDGTQGSSAIVTHAYNSNGNFTITLTVIDYEGLFDLERKSIVVQGIPQASFTYLPAAPRADQVVAFNASLSRPIGGTILSYHWDFGDGTTVNESSSVVEHSFSLPQVYTVTLNVTDTEGLWDTESQYVVIIKPPRASFVAYPSSAFVGETVTFNAEASVPEGGTIIAYSWSFGEGARTSGNSPTSTHVFQAKGTYDVALNVTDSEGLWDTEVAQIVVEEKPLQPWQSNNFILILIISVVIVVALASVLFLKRRL